MAGFQMAFDEVHRTLLYADQLGRNVKYQVRLAEQLRNPSATERPWRPEWKPEADRARDAASPVTADKFFQEQALGNALSPNEATLPGAELSNAYAGYEFADGELVKTYLRRIWSGQKFAPSATPWEMERSILAAPIANLLVTQEQARLPMVANSPRFSPVVVPGIIQDHAQVVGHVGRVQGDDLIAPTKLAGGSVKDVFARGVLFVAAEEHALKPPDGWSRVGVTDHSFVVLTTPDGQVLNILGTTDRGAAKELLTLEQLGDAVEGVAKWAWRNRWEIALSILIPELMPVALRLALRGRQVLRSLVGRLRGGAQVRGLLAGATAELAASVQIEATAVRGIYSEITGITRAHHQAFIEAAGETQSVIVVRHTNPKSIPLIEKGCSGKPKDLEFINTGPNSGIVMANTHPEVLKTQRLGYYVVNPDGKTAARFVKLGDKEVPAIIDLKAPFWQVEKGQVLDPKTLKPIVGDYDLMGVFPTSSPGQLVTQVTRNYGEMLTDVTNPIVQRAAAAVNRRLDIPRVLHGPQDMYKGFRKAASAYLPDGTVMHFESEEAVKAYYSAIGRQTRVGSHPRPSPETPVVDELAKRRTPKPTGWR